jgi:hypothetical protein
MAAPLYIAYNGTTGTTPFTDFPVAVTTGTSTSAAKTMLQIKPGTPKIRIVEWGYSFDAIPAAPVKVGLIETGTVFATVTTFNAADIMKYNDATGPASQCVTGTSASGFTASAEGTITAERFLAGQHDASQMFKQQFPLGREPEVNGGSSLRIRITMGSAAALNMVCYVIWEE